MVSSEHLSAHDEFRNFGRLPYELRRLIWECAIFVPRIVEAFESPDKTSRSIYNYWFPRCPLPAILTVCREAREIAREHYKFQPLSGTPSMKLFIIPDIDTLYFPYAANVLTFLRYTNEDDLRSIRNLALHERHLVSWTNHLGWCDISRPLSCIMTGLERLMVGVQIASHKNPAVLESRERGDNWTGWYFGDGPPNVEEDLVLSGENMNHVFSTQSIDGTLFYFHNEAGPDYSERYPGHVQLNSARLGAPRHEIFRYYYPTCGVAVLRHPRSGIPA